MRLTIYLPDFSDMLVYAAMDCTVNELIRIILKQHEQEDLDPPLDYRNPSIFELRMHEGEHSLLFFDRLCHNYFSCFIRRWRA